MDRCQRCFRKRSILLHAAPTIYTVSSHWQRGLPLPQRLHEFSGSIETGYVLRSRGCVYKRYFEFRGNEARLLAPERRGGRLE